VKKLLTSSKLVRVALAAGVLALGAATPAVATGGGGLTKQVNSAIKAGSKGETVGFGSFTRTRYESSQKLKVTLYVERGISDSHVCVGAKPFTSRVPPGQCRHASDTPSTTHTHYVDLADAAGPVYVQAHVATSDDQTAYAGWQSGNPFYGNLEIPDPGDGTPVPIGAIGALLLSGLVAGGLVLRGARR
jgi:hypothetical protein